MMHFAKLENLAVLAAKFSYLKLRLRNSITEKKPQIAPIFF
jgi:hypothetical protein